RRCKPCSAACEKSYRVVCWMDRRMACLLDKSVFSRDGSADIDCLIDEIRQKFVQSDFKNTFDRCLMQFRAGVSHHLAHFTFLAILAGKAAQIVHYLVV